MTNIRTSEMINWQIPQFDNANCLTVGDPELFFYNGKEKGAKAQIEAAKRVCENCVEKLRCLEFALDNEIKEGIWGGLSESERRRIARTRSKAS